MIENSEKLGKWLAVMDWEEHHDNPLRYVCSNCTSVVTKLSPTCLNCQSHNPKIGSLINKPGEIQF